MITESMNVYDLEVQCRLNMQNLLSTEPTESRFTNDSIEWKECTPLSEMEWHENLSGKVVFGEDSPPLINIGCVQNF